MIRERSCAVKEEKPCGSLGVEWRFAVSQIERNRAK